jgi:hypothetical protein
VGKGEEIRQLRSLLARYDTGEVAAVEARVRHACVTTRPEDAEEFALLITLDTLRLHGRVTSVRGTSSSRSRGSPRTTAEDAARGWRPQGGDL